MASFCRIARRGWVICPSLIIPKKNHLTLMKNLYEIDLTFYVHVYEQIWNPLTKQTQAKNFVDNDNIHKSIKSFLSFSTKLSIKWSTIILPTQILQNLSIQTSLAKRKLSRSFEKFLVPKLLTGGAVTILWWQTISMKLCEKTFLSFVEVFYKSWCAWLLVLLIIKHMVLSFAL